jgi:BON domain
MHRFREATEPLRRMIAALPAFIGRRRGGRGRPHELSLPPLLAGALAAIAAGAALEFFLDPRNGRRRRTFLRDRTRGALRRRTRQLERHAHYEAGKVIGLAHAITHSDQGPTRLDDVGLAHKVETELFRDRTIPKGQISINADRGIIVLRGQLQDQQQIARIERATRKIAGVREVENLLHPPGVPAPPSHPHGDPESRHPAA